MPRRHNCTPWPRLSAHDRSSRLSALPATHVGSRRPQGYSYLEGRLMALTSAWRTALTYGLQGWELLISLRTAILSTSIASIGHGSL